MEFGTYTKRSSLFKAIFVVINSSAFRNDIAHFVMQCPKKSQNGVRCLIILGDTSKIRVGLITTSISNEPTASDSLKTVQRPQRKMVG